MPCWIRPSPWRPGCSTHDTDAYYEISRAFLDKQPAGNLTRDNILDNITLYWLTGTTLRPPDRIGKTPKLPPMRAGQPRPQVKLPVGFTTFPGEIFRAPRAWVEKSYANVTYFNEVNKGGHFAAWDEPELFASEIRTAFKSLDSTPRRRSRRDDRSSNGSRWLLVGIRG